MDDEYIKQNLMPKAEIRDFVRQEIAAQMPELKQAMKEAMGEYFADMGVDTTTTTGRADFIDRWRLLGTIRVVRNRVGNTIVVMAVTALCAWAGSRLWGGAK